MLTIKQNRILATTKPKVQSLTSLPIGIGTDFTYFSQNVVGNQKHLQNILIKA